MAGPRGKALELTRPQADLIWMARLKREGVATLIPSRPRPPAAFSRGLQEFNDGDYWQAHETLEAVWLQAPYPLRLFYYALIKLAVGLFHVGQHNAVGARQQLAAAVEFLEPFTPHFLGLQTQPLYQEAQVWLRRLEKLPRPVVARTRVRNHVNQAERDSRETRGMQGAPWWEELDRVPRIQIQAEARGLEGNTKPGRRSRRRASSPPGPPPGAAPPG